MGTFKEDYDKRLRRICGVSDDTLRVEEDSKTIYSGYCETCYFEYDVITVTVYNKFGEEVAQETYDYMPDLIEDMDKVVL